MVLMIEEPEPEKAPERVIAHCGPKRRLTTREIVNSGIHRMEGHSLLPPVEVTIYSATAEAAGIPEGKIDADATCVTDDTTHVFVEYSFPVANGQITALSKWIQADEVTPRLQFLSPAAPTRRDVLEKILIGASAAVAAGLGISATAKALKKNP